MEATMRKICLALSLLIIIVMLFIPPTRNVRAQSSTATPFPTPTIAATSVPGSSGGYDLSGMYTPMASSFNLLATVSAQTNAISNTIAITSTSFITTNITAGNPFALARGIAVVMNELPWIGPVITWFFVALILIIIVEAIRLIVSLWGVVQRVLDVLKLIPFV
jgi:hypothetical protein